MTPYAAVYLLRQLDRAGRNVRQDVMMLRLKGFGAEADALSDALDELRWLADEYYAPRCDSEPGIRPASEARPSWSHDVVTVPEASGILGVSSKHVRAMCRSAGGAALDAWRPGPRGRWLISRDSVEALAAERNRRNSA